MTETVNRLSLDFFFIDLETRERCVGTDETLDAALAATAPALYAMGIRLEVRKTLIEAAEQAEAARFVSSPTIRLAGQDLAGELIESNCGACGDACGCGGEVNCREWSWRGGQYTQPPIGLLVERILAIAMSSGQADEATGDYTVPANLRRFFEGKAMKQRTAPAQPCCTDKSPTATCC